MLTLKKLIQTGFLSIVTTLPIACSSLKITDCLESSPLSELESQIKQITEDPEIKAFHENYFPNGKLEFSYDSRTKKAQTKTFIQPNINLRNGLDYTIQIGIEIKY